MNTVEDFRKAAVVGSRWSKVDPARAWNSGLVEIVKVGRSGGVFYQLTDRAAALASYQGLLPGEWLDGDLVRVEDGILVVLQDDEGLEPGGVAFTLEPLPTA